MLKLGELISQDRQIPINEVVGCGTRVCSQIDLTGIKKPNTRVLTKVK
jgi:hypothetical protein